MATPRLPRRTRDVIARSPLYVCVVTPAWLRDPHASAELAYAVALGKPIRLLIEPGLRLPEDLFQGSTDVQVARTTDPDASVAQMEAWLAELGP